MLKLLAGVVVVGVCTSLLVPALMAQSAQAELSTPVVVIPMDHSSGHVVVDVYIGDKGPYLFQVDTYASIDACLDDDVARELGFPVVGTTLNSDGHNTTTRNLVSIPELRLGGATFKDARTLVDDYGWIGERNGRSVDGLLGFTLFRELMLTFDYPNSQLVLSHEIMSAEATHSIPFRTPSGSPDIEISMGDTTLEFGIDTGLGGALSLHKEDADVLPLAGELKVIGQARTVYSTFDIYGGELEQSATLAGHSLEDLSVTFTEGAGRRLLGHEVLKHFAVSFDQRSQRVQFARELRPEP
ncbi:MAG: hypothetical protein ACI9EF_000377 [Pseudohongiellaceae bacterium]|jgi:hypothetical protein